MKSCLKKKLCCMIMLLAAFCISSSVNAADGFIFPKSDSSYLTLEDLQGLDANTLRLARNEIYARRGRRFKDDYLQSYFNSMSWYDGTISPEHFADKDMLNQYERANAQFILDYENNSLGGRTTAGYENGIAVSDVTDQSISGSQNTIEVSELGNLSIDEAARILGFSGYVEEYGVEPDDTDIYYFYYDGSIPMEKTENYAGELYDMIPFDFRTSHSHLWTVSENRDGWELYIMDPGYSFYGIEVGMSEAEAKRIGYQIPRYSSLGFWQFLCTDGIVSEIHTYYEG